MKTISVCVDTDIIVQNINALVEFLTLTGGTLDFISTVLEVIVCL